MSKIMGKTAEQMRSEHEARMAEKEVLKLAYHRNGVGGDGFYVALVRCPEADQRVLTVIVPAWAIEAGNDQDAAKLCPGAAVPCYVIDPGLASGPWTQPGTVAFGVNSWRGDHYFEVVALAIENGMAMEDPS